MLFVLYSEYCQAYLQGINLILPTSTLLIWQFLLKYLQAEDSIFCPQIHNHRLGRDLQEIIRMPCIVSQNEGLKSRLAHIASQVVDEGIVIIDDENHRTARSSSPASRRNCRAFASVSSYSASGSLRRVTPPPTGIERFPPSATAMRIATEKSAPPLSSM